MKKIGVFTISSKNYLSYTRTLMRSVEQHHPEYRRFLCLADEIDGCFDELQEKYEVILSSNIGIPAFRDMILRYDVMEFNTAVKPFMIKWLFDNTDLDIVIYLDPDIKLYSRLDKLEGEFVNGASVVLTPHITEPVEDGLNPSDYHMLGSGVFNLGFIAMRKCSEAIEFIEWWGRKLQTNCTADETPNLFTDQKWCDLAPCFLNNLCVFKNPGYNVAYWNLTQRQLSKDSDGTWSVNGSPLAFFHFSGIDPSRRELVSKHQNRFAWTDISICSDLFVDYCNELMKSGWKACNRWPYAYNQIDGFDVPTLMRKLYRKIHEEVQILDADVGEMLVGLSNQSADQFDSKLGKAKITLLMELVYQLRPDLQAAFCLRIETGRDGFAYWFEVSAEREYGLPKAVTKQALINKNDASCYEKKNSLELYTSQ